MNPDQDLPGVLSDRARSRVLIVGNSGAGKSTYAARLARHLGVPCLELDLLVWEPHQIAVPRPLAQVHADLDGFLARSAGWVLEGCDGDLAERALPLCSGLHFLNPGRAVCIANNQRRPHEPHKYDKAEDQARMLPALLAWVESYYTRDDPRSYAYHRRLFDGFSGPRQEFRDPPPLP